MQKEGEEKNEKKIKADFMKENSLRDKLGVSEHHFLGLGLEFCWKPGNLKNKKLFFSKQRKLFLAFSLKTEQIWA